MFIDGFLSLCSAAGNGAVTEMGLPREPISFALTSDRHPVTGAFGLARNATIVRFPSAWVSGSIGGLGLFTAPAAGAGDFLIAALPFATPRGIIGGGRAFASDTGDLVLSVDLLANYPLPSAHVDLPFMPGAQIGQFWDAAAIGPLSVVPGPGAYVPAGGYLPGFLNSQPVTAGSSLLLRRGVLSVQTT